MKTQRMAGRETIGKLHGDHWLSNCGCEERTDTAYLVQATTITSQESINLVEIAWWRLWPSPMRTSLDSSPATAAAGNVAWPLDPVRA